jgi:hypothetical protein
MRDLQNLAKEWGNTFFVKFKMERVDTGKHHHPLWTHVLSLAPIREQSQCGFYLKSSPLDSSWKLLEALEDSQTVFKSVVPHQLLSN